MTRTIMSNDWEITLIDLREKLFAIILKNRRQFFKFIGEQANIFDDHLI